MSNIPYPHSVTIIRPSGSASEDEMGRPVHDESEHATVAAWVQIKSAREQSQLTMSGGPTIADHTVFMEASDITASDYLVTIAGGGQIDGVVHRIVGIRDPDGTGDHLELDTRVVREVGA